MLFVPVVQNVPIAGKKTKFINELALPIEPGAVDMNGLAGDVAVFILD